MEKKIIAVNVIHSFMASCLNRDEGNEPKTMYYGGVLRTRISSQCRKSTWRRSDFLNETIDDALIEIRTKHLPEIVREKIKERGFSDTVAYQCAIDTALHFGGYEKKSTETNVRSSVLRSYAKNDINRIIDYVVDQLKNNEDVKKKAEKIKRNGVIIPGNKGKKKVESGLIDYKGFNESEYVTVRSALFGRMIAEEKGAKTIPAAVHVAHAFSVNRAEEEADFFTATDDLVEMQDDQGASHMDYLCYSSNAFYETAYIDMDILSDNLKNLDDKDKIIKAIVPALIEAMILETPNAKQTTFASRPAPTAILIEMQNKKVVFDYASAFEKPIYPHNDETISALAEQALIDKCENYDRKYGNIRGITDRLWFSCDDLEMVNATNCESLDDIMSAIKTALL